MWRGIGAVLGGWLVGDFWIVAWFGRGVRELVGHWRGAFSEFWLGFDDSPGRVFSCFWACLRRVPGS